MDIYRYLVPGTMVLVGSKSYGISNADRLFLSPIVNLGYLDPLDIGTYIFLQVGTGIAYLLC
jgi:hypothetical protein